MKHVAVIDIGKTNAKLALVESEGLREIAVVTRPNVVLQDGPYPHFGLDGHWQFFLRHLADFQSAHGVDAISVTTHGASIVLLDENGDLATP
ncbi:MAG: carbohydrate kinase, partial [Paracoccaceae bacterium]